MNQLFEYGIQTENSDVRAHVSVVNRTIYAFPTATAVMAIKKHQPEEREATQPGAIGPTARGYVVPIELIPDLRKLPYHSWLMWSDFRPELNTSEKGKLAVQCVIDCMKIGRFPFWIDASEDERQNVQIGGTDIVVFCRKKIQVKCDWKCGEKPNGTGNLFLQSAERNPFKRI